MNKVWTVFYLDRWSDDKRFVLVRIFSTPELADKYQEKHGKDYYVDGPYTVDEND